MESGLMQAVSIVNLGAWISRVCIVLNPLHWCTYIGEGESFVDNESEVRKLEHQLSDYRHIIGQQEEMLLQVQVIPNYRLL